MQCNLRGCSIALMLGVFLGEGALWAQQPGRAGDGTPRVATAKRVRPSDYFRSAASSGEEEHPLMPALRWAKAGVEDIRALADYSCTFVKRERIDGELSDYEYFEMKVRHEPFSVYLKFLKPEKFAGREVIYVNGANKGNLWAHPNGLQNKLIGTVSLKPTGAIAMQGNRYPITEAGILNLTERLIQIGSEDAKYGECEVKFIEGAKINNRPSTCIQVIHPVPRRNFTFHMARIYVDDEFNVPTRYEAFDWPAEPGGDPVPTEEYTYLDLQFNTGLTDTDFDVANPSYDFKRK